MKKKLFAMSAALVAVAGGLVYAGSFRAAQSERSASAPAGYICPATGEELPCANCCPLKRSRQ